LKLATTAPDFSLNTGKGFNNSCLAHSETPNLAVISSSNNLVEKQRVGNFYTTSL
jgi:hypothetical protein